MAYAAYRESFGQLTRRPVTAAVSATVVIDVTVPSGDALKLRRALAACQGAGVLRCIPRPDEHRVKLEIRLPLAAVDALLHEVMVCVPDGEIGHLTSWSAHLRRHGLREGN